ncbi:unnamed protein product [Gadus morhua 'NCC']
MLSRYGNKELTQETENHNQAGSASYVVRLRTAGRIRRWTASRTQPASRGRSGPLLELSAGCGWLCSGGRGERRGGGEELERLGPGVSLCVFPVSGLAGWWLRVQSAVDSSRGAASHPTIQGLCP